MWKLVLLASASVGVSLGALAISGKRCGSTTMCMLHQYCSAYHNQCENCSVVCEAGSHNFDESTCTQECQDYLHDKRYGTPKYSEDMENKVNLIVYLVAFVAILTALRCGRDVFKWARRNDYLSARCFKRFSQRSRNNKPPIDPMTHENPHTQSPRMTKKGANGDRRVCSRLLKHVSVDTVQTAITPVSRRHPAEDSTLDYTYDNRGLETTPVSEKPKNETTF